MNLPKVTQLGCDGPRTGSQARLPPVSTFVTKMTTAKQMHRKRVWKDTFQNANCGWLSTRPRSFLLISYFYVISHKHSITSVNYLGAGCFADLIFFKDNSSTSQDSCKPEPESTVEVGVGARGAQEALAGHLGQPSVCCRRPCYLVPNRWPSLHHSLPGCRVSGWKLQKHPAGKGSSSEHHWMISTNTALLQQLSQHPTARHQPFLLLLGGQND